MFIQRACRFLFGFLIAALVISAPLSAAGTVTVAEETFGSVKKITFTWTSTAGGAADGATTFTYNGAIERLVTVPAGGGSAPSDDYDITIVDGDNTDVLMGAGANRDTANTEQVLASSLGVVANDTLTLHVTNAGATKGGVVYLYLR